MGGDYSRALNAVTMAITGALGGQTDLQVGANTLAPYAAQAIGEQWGHGADKNTAAQLAAHAILGATLAYINGGDPAAGGSAAVASEAAATYFTNQYKDKEEYQDKNGVFQPNLLPEDVKTQIRDLTAGIGAVIGGAAGDSTYNAQLAGVIGQNAVENNVDSVKDIQNAKAYSEKMYKDTCAAYGLGEPACGIQIRKDGFEILKGTALVLLPTEPYEFIPVGKGVGIVLKGTNKLIAVYKDIKAAEKAVEKSGAKVIVSNANIGTKIDDKVIIIKQTPLKPTVVESFKNGKYQTVITNEDVAVYRKFGGGDNQAKLNGGYATTEKNASRNATAVYPSWSSSRFEAEIIIPKGTTLNIGKVGQQPPTSASPKYTGGADQILLPQNYSSDWVKSIRDGKTGKVYTLDEFQKAFPKQVKR
jgi:hypothetical protein